MISNTMYRYSLQDLLRRKAGQDCAGYQTIAGVVNVLSGNVWNENVFTYTGAHNVSVTFMSRIDRAEAPSRICQGFVSYQCGVTWTVDSPRGLWRYILAVEPDRTYNLYLLIDGEVFAVATSELLSDMRTAVIETYNKATEVKA